MIGYAIGSLFGMMAISSIYGLIYTKISKALSLKISQAWAHRPARFIILLILAAQVIICLGMNFISWYLLYQGATFVPYASGYGYDYTGADKIVTAWVVFGFAMAISILSDILKGILVLTFAD
ncbi:TPA_asm: hypothetical protein GBX16_22860 [Salmonella enterica subsp. enterica serovar Mbandaka]|uniref:Uncharacterized protein n=1 Tax=Salmonella enterica subsp. enterica serovar Mbandaka TaxID=192954 RepID=A0A6Y3UZX4_SALET|nr:hypothetical protein [Salmonella enterica subsp. enterica serovar Mbandaka]HAB2032032.1 hypothetical protein [Salmonella enterica subsp. enterica serovar Mbandaka]HAB5338364.1 hypothetical protein [Salmonella enterica subsp. enterica serovar Mbandaka]